MTYEEVIANIRDLGFSDNEEIQDFGELVPNAIERAITEINVAVPTAAPRNAYYDFTVDSTTNDPIYIDMEDIDDAFMEFADTEMLFKKTVLTENEKAERAELTEKQSLGTITEEEEVRLTNLNEKENTRTYTRFHDFDIMNESTIILDPTGYDGDFRVIYKKSHERFTGASAQLQEQIPLNRKVHHLVELLAAYYVWIEDEPTKAAQYYNMYETELNEVKMKSMNKKPRMRVLAGGI